MNIYWTQSIECCNNRVKTASDKSFQLIQTQQANERKPRPPKAMHPNEQTDNSLRPRHAWSQLMKGCGGGVRMRGIGTRKEIFQMIKTEKGDHNRFRKNILNTQLWHNNLQVNHKLKTKMNPRETQTWQQLEADRWHLTELESTKKWLR